MKLVPPYLFQTNSAQRMDALGGRGLIAADPGLGKSKMALMYAQAHPEARPIIVVCPASIKWVWLHEIRVHTGWGAEILEGTKVSNRRPKPMHPVVIINYDILHAWLEYLERLKLQLAIVDEIHFCASRSSRRSRAVKRLCAGVPNVIGLSGTPLVNRPADLWQPLNIIRPDLFKAFYPFARRYCAARRTPFGYWDTRGSSNTKELNALLCKELLIRYRKEDVLKDLPPKRRIVVPLPLSNRKEYEDALHNFVGWLRKNKGEVAAGKASRSYAITQLSALKQLAAQLKLPAALAWLDDWLADSEGKLIGFAVHRAMLRKLHERYPKMSVMVDGSVTGKDRKIATKRFLKQKHIRLFFGQIKATGVGWSAPGVTDVALFEYPWAPADANQAIDRAHGIGRGKEGVATTSWWLTAKDTIEAALLKILQRKQKVISAVLDGKNNSNELNVYDELMEALLKGSKT